jgi:TRAP-type mannitol/chloroaromatic compound transport system permease large subunit
VSDAAIATKEVHSMNKSKRTPLAIAFIVVAVFFLIFMAFGGGAMMNTMMGSATMGGITWMWFPTLFTFVLGVFIGWLLFRKKT